MDRERSRPRCRPASEEVIALALTGSNAVPRVVEAIPALLGWNEINPTILRAYGIETRTIYRLAWLADVAVTVDRRRDSRAAAIVVPWNVSSRSSGCHPRRLDGMTWEGQRMAFQSRHSGVGGRLATAQTGRPRRRASELAKLQKCEDQAVATGTGGGRLRLVNKGWGRESPMRPESNPGGRGAKATSGSLARREHPRRGGAMASEDILSFLAAVDVELAAHANAGDKLDLHLLGRSALIIGYGAKLMTKDVDVVHVDRSRLLRIAVEKFGRASKGHLDHGFYLEAVSSGLPPLPIGYQGRCLDVPGSWRIICPKRPEAHDLIVTKLRRFHAGDREDITILCDTGEVDEDTLRGRFDLAHAFSDRDDPRVVMAAKHLQAVSDYLRGRRKKL